MKNSKLNSMLDIIKDKNLYGRNFFFSSLPSLIVGLVIQYYIYYLLTPQLLIIYVPFYFGLIFLVSGLFTKNFKKEFHPMELWLAYLLFYTSVFSKAFAVIAPFENTFIGFLERLLVMIISEPAFIFSLITLVVLGQRFSLRNNVGLRDNFFDKEKNRWKSELGGFPNLDKILESLDGGRFVANLFDKGFFNLTILWSCNVMEEVIDAITNGIISKIPEKKTLFRTEEGRPLSYPLQLKNLGYKPYQENRNKEKRPDIDTLWHQVRNKIAHHNYKPTFNETNETIKILTSFIKEMPMILHNRNSF